MNCLVSTPPAHTSAIKVFEQWDEDKTPFRRNLCLDAATYKPATIFDCPPMFCRSSSQYVVSPKQTLAYCNRILPARQPLSLYGRQEGNVIWNGDVVIPTLIDLRRCCRTGEWFPPETPLQERAMYGAIWMSLTPMEMMTQRSALKLAWGTVVIGGLGLGWLLRKVCEKAEVRQVIVVEKSQELLDWFGCRICKDYSKVSDVICDDIYNQIGNHGPTAKYLLDIWHLYTGAADDPELVPFRRKFRRRLWAWGLD